MAVFDIGNTAGFAVRRARVDIAGGLFDHVAIKGRRIAATTELHSVPITERQIYGMTRLSHHKTVLCLDPPLDLKLGAHFVLQMVTTGFAKCEHGALLARSLDPPLSGAIYHPHLASLAPPLVHFSRKRKPHPLCEPRSRRKHSRSQYTSRARFTMRRPDGQGSSSGRSS